MRFEGVDGMEDPGHVRLMFGTGKQGARMDSVNDNEKDRWDQKSPGELARDPLTWWSVAALKETLVITRLEFLAEEGMPTEHGAAVQLLLDPTAAIELGRALLSRGESLLATPPPETPRN